MKPKQTSIFGNSVMNLYTTSCLFFKEQRLVFLARKNPDEEEKKQVIYKPTESNKPLTDVDELIQQVPDAVLQEIKKEIDRSPIQLPSGQTRDERFRELILDYLEENPPTNGYYEKEYFTMRDRWHDRRRILRVAEDEIADLVAGKTHFGGLAPGKKVDEKDAKLTEMMQKFKGKINEEELKKKTNKEMAEDIGRFKQDLIGKKESVRQEVIDEMDTDLKNRIHFLQKLWNDPKKVYQHKQKSALYNLDYLEKKVDFAHNLAKLTPALRAREFTDRKQQRALKQLDIKGDIDDIYLRFIIDSELRALEIESHDLIEEDKKGHEDPDVLTSHLNDLRGDSNKLVFEIVDRIKKTDPKVAEIKRKLNELYNQAAAFHDRDPKHHEEVLKSIQKEIDAVNKIENAEKMKSKFLDEFETLDNMILIAKDSKTSQKEKAAILFSVEESIPLLEKSLKGYPEKLEKSCKDLLEEIDHYKHNFEHGHHAHSHTEYVWMSAFDLTQMWHTIKEWSKRRTDRRAKDVTGKVGRDIFRYDFWPFKTLGHEFDREREHAEHEEVGKYKDAYKETKDAWEVENIMEKTTNKDEFKACIELLTEWGRLHWESSKLWKALNRFQKVEHFDIHDKEKEMRDMMKLHDKIHKAIGNIWNYDDYYKWKQANDNNYESAKKSVEQEANMLAEQEGGGLNKALSGMLRAWQETKKHGGISKVKDTRYEGILQYALDRGKLTPEAKLYYLIQGLASGLLSWDRLSWFDSEKLNDYPVLELFACGTQNNKYNRPTWDDLQSWALVDGDNYEPSKAFNTWFWCKAMHKEKVLQRVDKVVSSGKKLDHDDFTAIAAFMHDTSVDNLLNRSGGDYRLPSTGYQNMTVAFLNYMDNMALNSEEIGKGEGHEEFVKEQTLRLMQTFFRFDAITSNRMYKNRGMQYYRFSEGQLKEGPRSKDYYVHGGNNDTRFYMDTMRKYMREIDPEVMDTLFSKTALIGATADDEKAKVSQFVKKLKRKYGEEVFGKGEAEPQDLDQVYTLAGNVMETILTKEPHRLTQMLQFIEQEVRNDVNENKITAHTFVQLQADAQAKRTADNNRLNEKREEPTFE